MRYIILPSLLLILAGCSFRPLYKKNSSFNGPEVIQVKLKKGEGYYAHFLRRAVYKQLNLMSSRIRKKYILELSVIEGLSDLVYSPDGTASRTQITLTANYDVLQGTDYQSVYKSFWQLSNSYTVNQAEEFANLTAKQSSENRLVEVMAMDIARDVHAHLIDLEQNTH